MKRCDETIRLRVLRVRVRVCLSVCLKKVSVLACMHVCLCVCVCVCLGEKGVWGRRVSGEEEKISNKHTFEGIYLFLPCLVHSS